jgi:hypothetical protein
MEYEAPLLVRSSHSFENHHVCPFPLIGKHPQWVVHASGLATIQSTFGVLLKPRYGQIISSSFKILLCEVQIRLHC